MMIFNNKNNIHICIFQYFHLFVISELDRDKKLQKFFQINEVPSALQISEFISRFHPDTFVKITKNILMQTKPIKKRVKTNIYC